MIMLHLGPCRRCVQKVANGASPAKRKTPAKSILSKAADTAADTIPAVATPVKRAIKAIAAKTPAASAPKATRASARTPAAKRTAA